MGSPWKGMATGCMFSLLWLAGCAQAPPKPTPQAVYEFPPQKAMESRDYASFLEENQKALENCTPEAQCGKALFNVAFVYAYPESPYYNRPEGLRRMQEVVEKYPESAWAYQAKAMAVLLKTRIVFMEPKKRTRMKRQLKSKESRIEKLQDQIERSREIDLEIDRKERELLQ